MVEVVASLGLGWPCPILCRRNPALPGRSAACWRRAGLLRRKERTFSLRGIGGAGYIVCPAPPSCPLPEGGTDVPDRRFFHVSGDTGLRWASPKRWRLAASMPV